MKTAKYFTAQWCSHCVAFKPIMQEIANEGYSVSIIDVDLNRTEAQKYGIRSMPTVIILENGKEVNRFIGVQQKSTITEALNGG